MQLGLAGCQGHGSRHRTHASDMSGAGIRKHQTLESGLSSQSVLFQHDQSPERRAVALHVAVAGQIGPQVLLL